MGQVISSFRELRVYRLAFELQQEVFALSKKYPPEEKFALTDQIRRSSRSIGANIAEAWQKRRYAAHFVSKLTDADGEQAETQHWIDTAAACEYLTKQEQNGLMQRCLRIGQMLGAMMANPDQWCDTPR
jgi:four helix bundle protein